MLITRRAFAATALSLTALVTKAMAVPAAVVTKPQALADMALGPADAKVTIVEYAASTCPHCAAFNRDVFPKIKSEFIDTGKIRYVFREFPLNIKDLACAMLTRRIAGEDAAKYFAVVDIMFRQQDQLVKQTSDTLRLIGRQAGLSTQAVEDCLKDQAMQDKISSGQKYAEDVLKVEGTPTFFINGDEIVGEAAFEELASRINSLLKS
ncbi:thioredoxin domain-containing protein [Afipia sp. GAS231]|uniref:thioredoxin domain-containing protein n=1 Tax=Afipia sp. GAS231 TaxID=1882747 RepID=UPI00087A613B|nr:thioredoxin domain-containing protein [Afipia sp. GAS231]SDO95055.1 Protein-disulfide isomerase [Afipia sp. GAS231]